MVDIHVNDNNNQIRINVNPTSNSVSSTIGNETFYNGLAKEWAISPDLVQGIDYSSKYYAGKAKESADIAESAIEDIAESAIEDIGTAKDEAIDDISDAKTDAISDMETAKTEKITEIENTASDFEDDLTLLTQRAETAATNAQNSADYVVNNAPTATVTQTSTGATITTKDLTHGTTTANILNGAKGDKGDKGDTGDTGATGNGIVNIEKASTVGLVDTYHVNYTNGNYDSFNVTNGRNGEGSVADVTVNGVSVLDGSVAKVLVPTNNNQLTNGAGYITASALTGYATEQWVSNQNYVNSTTLATTLADYQPLLVSGTNIKTINNTSILGSGDITIQSAPDIDEISITTNSDDELQTVGVIDQNNTANAIKTWTGTKAQYDAIVTKDSNTLYWLTDAKITYLGNNAIGNFSGGRNVGEVVASAIPLTDAGLHLLDGALIQGSGIYSAFVTYIAGLVSTYPNLFVTESAWQQSVTTYGSCGKFVYDSTNNTVRLPKVSDILQGTTDVTALGDLVEAGLPNIKGTWTSVTDGGQLSGATYQVSDYSGDLFDRGDSGGWGTARKLGFNASRSSSIYGKSLTVQPQTIKVLYYIVIANSTKTEIQVDIDEIATDLNGKADVDLSNISASQSAKNEIVSWGMPDWNNSISYTNNTNTNTAPSDGFIMLYYVPNSGTGYFQINGQNVASCIISTTYRTSACGMFVINKNDTFKITAVAVNDSYSRFVYKFIPMKGAN